ncbi:15427_t:CDS:2, partial [Dentiscutata erythropus]
EPTSVESLNITEDYVNDEYEDIAWFSLTDMEILIANCFESEEYSRVRFSGTLKFDEDFVNNVPSENQESDKEVTYRFVSEVESVSDNIELNIYNQNELIEFRKAELEEDKKVFESLITIVSENIQNDHFYDVYVKLKRTLISETVACQEALRARRQQKTWDPPRGSKLAFWLQ